MNRITLASLLLLPIFIGCSPRYYVPTAQNVPLISSKGEGSLTLDVTGSEYDFGLQTAYAPFDNVAFQLNGAIEIMRLVGESGETIDGGSGKLIEGGVGYFRPIDDHFSVEVYGIFGVGDVENHFPSTLDEYPGTTGKISATILRYGIQPDFGFHSKYIDAAVSARLLNLVYTNIDGSLIFDTVDQVDYLTDNSSNIVFEPAIMVRVGLERVKVVGQGGLSLNLTNREFRQEEKYVRIGLNVKFNLL